MSKQKKDENLPALIEDQDFSPVLSREIPAEIMEAMPLLGAILKNYPFVKEKDEDGNYLPDAVEQNMLSQAKLAGDLYVLTKVAGLTQLGKGSLEELMCLTPRMEAFLGIENGKSKTIELEGRRIPERDHSEAEFRDTTLTEANKAPRKRKAVKRVLRGKRKRN